MGKQIEVTDDAHRILKIASVEAEAPMKELASDLIEEEYGDD